jgi:endogenous inhibitor of DNA gyrase (YacG/DUF329 family)
MTTRRLVYRRVLTQIVTQAFPNLPCIMCKTTRVANEHLEYLQLYFTKKKRLVLVPYCSTNDSCLVRARQILREYLRLDKRLHPSFTITCPICGTSVPKLKRCSRCGYVGYCSTQCQKADWSNHKKSSQASPDKIDSVD